MAEKLNLIVVARLGIIPCHISARSCLVNPAVCSIRYTTGICFMSSPESRASYSSPPNGLIVSDTTGYPLGTRPRRFCASTGGREYLVKFFRNSLIFGPNSVGEACNVISFGLPTSSR